MPPDVRVDGDAAEVFTLRAAGGDGIERLTAGNYGGRPGGEA